MDPTLGQFISITSKGALFQWQKSFPSFIQNFKSLRSFVPRTRDQDQEYYLLYYSIVCSILYNLYYILNMLYTNTWGIDP